MEFGEPYKPFDFQKIKDKDDKELKEEIQLFLAEPEHMLDVEGFENTTVEQLNNEMMNQLVSLGVLPDNYPKDLYPALLEFAKFVNPSTLIDSRVTDPRPRFERFRRALYLAKSSPKKVILEFYGFIELARKLLKFSINQRERLSENDLLELSKGMIQIGEYLDILLDNATDIDEEPLPEDWDIGSVLIKQAKRINPMPQ